MIDLDILAETRAKALNQNQEQWRKIVWTPEFQALSQALSDGEIEMFFDSCRSTLHFEIMTKYLFESLSSGGITFTEMMEKVARSGYQFVDWVDAIVRIRQYLDISNKNAKFFEILMFVNACALQAAQMADPLVGAVEKELLRGRLGQANG